MLEFDKGTRKFHLCGWSIFSDGFYWKVQNPKGHTYHKTFKSLFMAEHFIEQRL